MMCPFLFLLVFFLYQRLRTIDQSNPGLSIQFELDFKVGHPHKSWSVTIRAKTKNKVDRCGVDARRPGRHTGYQESSTNSSLHCRVHVSKSQWRNTYEKNKQREFRWKKMWVKDGEIWGERGCKYTDQKWPTAMPSRSPITPWYPLERAQLKRTRAYGRWPAEMVMTPKSDRRTFEFSRAHRYTSVKLNGADRNGAGDSGERSWTVSKKNTSGWLCLEDPKTYILWDASLRTYQ
jgi:hypothetical protein